MRRLIINCLGLLFFSGQIAYALPVQQNTLYMCTLETNSKLYTINHINAKKTLVGAMGTGRICTDLAFSGTKLYATSLQKLYTLEPTTGKVVKTKWHGFDDINALTVGGTGQLYAAGSSNNRGLGGRLIRIDSTTGKGALIGYLGSGLTSAGDIAFLGGRLYATVNKAQSPTTWLAKINTVNGKATLVGNIGYANVWGLAVRNSVLYATTSDGKLLKVNSTTGKSNLIGINNAAQVGLTKAP